MSEKNESTKTGPQLVTTFSVESDELISIYKYGLEEKRNEPDERLEQAKKFLKKGENLNNDSKELFVAVFVELEAEEIICVLGCDMENGRIYNETASKKVRGKVTEHLIYVAVIREMLKNIPTISIEPESWNHLLCTMKCSAQYIGERTFQFPKKEIHGAKFVVETPVYETKGKDIILYGEKLMDGKRKTVHFFVRKDDGYEDIEVDIGGVNESSKEGEKFGKECVRTANFKEVYLPK